MQPAQTKVQSPTMPVRAIVLTLVLCIIFGADQISRKMALASFGPLESGTWAYCLGSFALWIYTYVSKISWKPPSSQIVRWHILSAFLSVLVNAVGLIGLQFTNASRATVFISTYPFFVMMLAWLIIQREDFSVRKVIGLCVACTGIAIVLTHRLGSGRSHFAGDVLMLCSAFLLAVMILHLRRVTQVVHPLQATLWQLTLSIPAFIIGTFYFEKPSLSNHSTPSWLALLYQGIIINAVSFVVRAELIRRYGAATIAVYFFLTPIVGVFLSSFFLHEPLSIRIFFGSLIVGIGIILVQYAPRTRSAFK